MKMTIHIGDDLLKRAMDHYALETETDAIHFALSDLERRAKMKEFKNGLGLAPEDFIDAIDPASYDKPLSRVAETPSLHGTPRPD